MSAEPFDLPLTPTVFFTMLALADGPKHGYAIMKVAVRLSEGRVKMGPGALYTTIQRLVEARLIEETEGEEGEDARRRLYKLTKSGRSLFEIELERMESVVRAARGLVPGPSAR
jgi:DNA-binding PadR family transcriptional regulator